MEVRNVKPWANPDGYSITHTLLTEKGRSKEWQLFIDQSNFKLLRQTYFYQIPVDSFENGLFWPGLSTVALFRVRRKILHGYKVRDCGLADDFSKKTYPVSDVVVAQHLRITEKQVTNYAYPYWYWHREHSFIDNGTIAIFRVKRKGVHNG